MESSEKLFIGILLILCLWSDRLAVAYSDVQKIAVKMPGVRPAKVRIELGGTPTEDKCRALAI